MDYSTFFKYSHILEHSKNDFIPEISRMRDHLGIFVIGAPGVGKTTFVRSYMGTPKAVKQNTDETIYIPNLVTHNGIPYKVFNPDSLALLYNKSPELRKVGASRITYNSLMTYIKYGKNFVYDSTGNNVEMIKNIFNGARDNGYKIIFIHKFAELEVAKIRNNTRIRSVDDDYLVDTFYKKVSNEFQKLKPDNYYIVYEDDGMNKYLKYDGNDFYTMDKFGEYVKIEPPNYVSAAV